MPKFNRLTPVMRIRGVDVYFHWSVFVISAIILLGALKQPLLSLVGLMAYLSVLILHESGHMVAAQRKGCEVHSIDIYPIVGLCRHEAPWSQYDACVISWAGVLAQFAVAAPCIVWLVLFGYPKNDVAAELLGILGGFSAGVAVLNLLPIRPLDGATAWRIVPLLLHRTRSQKARAAAGRYR